MHDGHAGRWCQSCSRIHGLVAFMGVKRTCTAQLEAMRVKRKGRLSRMATSVLSLAADLAEEARGAQVPETELMDFLSSLDGGGGLLEGLVPQAVPGLCGELQALLREGGDCDGDDWPIGDTPFGFAQLGSGESDAEQLQHTAVALKCPHPPDQLPSGLTAALHSWAGAQPPALQGVAEPGCTLLTVDLLVEAPRIGALGADQLAQALKSEGGGCEALACACGGGPEEAQDDALRAPQPLACSLALQPRVPVVLQLAGAVQQGRVLRCRAHGQLLRCSVEGATLTLPDTPLGFAHGCLLLDLQPSGIHLAPPARPRPVLLTSCPRTAEELRLRLSGWPEAQTLPLLLLLGQALQPGGADTQDTLGQRACAACLRHALPHTLRLVLAAAGRTPAGALSLCISLAAQQSGDQQATLLALLLAHAQPDDALAALHAAALLCASPHSVTALAGCAAAELLIRHSASAAHAWYTLLLHLPSGGAVRPGGKTLWTPHAIALRGTHPSARRLTQQLHAQLQSAESELDALLRAQPPGQARLNALQSLPSAPPPGVDAQHWALCLHLARQLSRRSAAERSNTRRLRCSCALWLAASHLINVSPATLPSLRAWMLGLSIPPLRVEELHLAMRSGPLPVSMLREFYNAPVLFGPWLPIHGCILLVALLGRRSTVLRLEAAQQHAMPAMNVLVFYVWHTVLHLRTVGRWRLAEAGAELVWGSRMAAVQVCVSLSFVARSVHLPPRWASLFLLTRACFLSLGLLAPELYVVPLTLHARTLLPMQVLVLVCGAVWRCGSPGVWRPRRGVKEA